MKGLEQLIEIIVKRFVRKQCFNGIVTKVNRENDTCTVLLEDGGLELFEVRLNAVVDDLQKKVVVYPKLNSRVLCSLVDNDPNEACIIKYSEIEEVVLKVDKIVINDGTLGGMVKAKELEEQLNKHKAILEAIIQLANNPILITELGNGAPSAFQAALKGALTEKETGDFSKLENDKVLH